MFRALIAHPQEAGLRMWEDCTAVLQHPETNPHLQPHTTVTNPAFVYCSLCLALSAPNPVETENLNKAESEVCIKLVLLITKLVTLILYMLTLCLEDRDYTTLKTETTQP
jgi:hypothetical protein